MSDTAFSFYYNCLGAYEQLIRRRLLYPLSYGGIREFS